MSQPSYGAIINAPASTQAHWLHAVLNLRLALGWSVLAGVLIFFFGVSWDLQWHTFIGRDRTLIPPHIMMLLGVTITGLAALALVLIETTREQHNPALAQYSTTFAGRFSGPLGAYLAGFGALNSALALVLDSYWHALYGVDTPILAPFHVMLLAGVAISGLGAAYLLVGVACLAKKVGTQRKIWSGYLGASMAFSVIMTILALLTIETVMNDQRGPVSLFPPLAGLGCTWVLVAAVHAIPWRWTATVVSAITILLLLLMAAFVPGAMDLLMSLEHLSYRDIIPSHFDPHLAMLAILWPLTTAWIAAFLLDQSLTRARRKGWSQRRMIRSLMLSALPILLPVMPILPISFILIFLPSVMGGLVSLGLGLLGIGTGVWLGLNTGKAMQTGR